MRRNTKVNESEGKDIAEAEALKSPSKGWNWSAIAMLLLFGLPTLLTGVIFVSLS